MKDVGFGMTVQDKNAPDLVPLYEISMKWEWSLQLLRYITVSIS